MCVLPPPSHKTNVPCSPAGRGEQKLPPKYDPVGPAVLAFLSGSAPCLGASQPPGDEVPGQSGLCKRAVPGLPQPPRVGMEAWPVGGALRGNTGRARRGGAGRGGGSLHPLPRSAKVCLGSGRVAAAAGEEVLGHRVVCCSSAPGRSQVPGGPVASRSGPEGMRQPQGPRLPGSAARASVSGE